MGERGPSPLVPLLVVGALGLIICGPFLLSLWGDIIVPLLQIGSGVAILVLVLLLLVHLVSSLFPTFGMSSSFATTSASASAYDGDGFVIGMFNFLLLLLFLVLYRL
ncbi:hypothetical protein PanWU01x14_178790, partial [Parasponia andersonii]